MTKKNSPVYVLQQRDIKTAICCWVKQKHAVACVRMIPQTLKAIATDLEDRHRPACRSFPDILNEFIHSFKLGAMGFSWF